jgi:hypothetical protein
LSFCRNFLVLLTGCSPRASRPSSREAAVAAAWAFRKGTGVAEAEIFGCIRFCGSERDTAEITIARR